MPLSLEELLNWTPARPDNQDVMETHTTPATWSGGTVGAPAPAAPMPGSAFRAEVIAEIGVNHCGSLDRALELVHCAREHGADAVKFQTFDAGRLASPGAGLAPYQKNAGASAAADQLALLRALELPRRAFRRIFSECERLGIEFLSTPFDCESATFLCGLGVRRFKIGSGDVTNIPLLQRVGGFRLPVILSTGMATDEEIVEAAETLQGSGARTLTLLHCISRYPAPADDQQLLRIPYLRSRFGLPVGFSDHSLGADAALGARALGARVIEKHLTLDASLDGPDHAASADPEGFAELTGRLRSLERMLGDGVRRFHSEEEEIRRVARKSLVAWRGIGEGELFGPDNLAVLRPEGGIHPREWGAIVGRRAARAVAAGEPLRWEHVM